MKIFNVYFNEDITQTDKVILSWTNDFFFILYKIYIFITIFHTWYVINRCVLCLCINHGVYTCNGSIFCHVRLQEIIWFNHFFADELIFFKFFKAFTLFIVFIFHNYRLTQSMCLIDLIINYFKFYCDIYRDI